MASKVGLTLEQTPTWAVAVVCFVLVAISVVIEHIIHLVGEWLTKRNKKALYEALEKIKSELMLLGFISLLLTVGQGPISGICVSKAIGATWHPCSKRQENKYQGVTKKYSGDNSRRNLLAFLEDTGENQRRVLASPKDDKCGAKGQVPFVSTYGIHQLHIFIFVLAVFHVLYCLITLALGQAKMKKWKSWEMETRTTEYQFTHDPERFRYTRETTFGRRHLNFWSNSPILRWIACFFRQFVRSIAKVDYLTLRHGFIIAHLAPQGQTNFDFQKYIQRSLEEDFKVVVGISPLIWLFAVLFLLFNTHGLYSYLWLPFIPLIIILLVGTKLQVIITKMGLRIEERGGVVKGTPVVEPGDELFWFNRPRLLLYLIHFVLFQNAFQLAFFAWAWYEFGLRSCFHENVVDIVIRLTMGVVIQILCSYVTLPLYALVTQMGTTMKPTIFNEKVAKALRNWHYNAKKHIKQNNRLTDGSVPPSPSRPVIHQHGMSPVHLLRHYRSSEIDSVHTTSRNSHFDNEYSENEGSFSPSHSCHHDDAPPRSHHGRNRDLEVQPETEGQEMSSFPPDPHAHHEIDIPSAGFRGARI
ncbi:MLO-like protein 6 isoform X2 [Camellia sinensis]|uniref:MLO-like protein 6 isoform X1 n=1 Tax=Camellia sinensis TaxID=4442 RepID=UPI00103550DA|nr:MLO-like protein 6 isoform X1 [Camellia sinensis]XP_028064664.1 MLO-like protein 6 isoform X2 [Camellia sinensis]